jgi:cytochrome c biogenesis protein CcmG/thiol:disulfide interchange protein DsbE
MKRGLFFLIVAVAATPCGGGDSTRDVEELPAGIVHKYTVPAGTAAQIARGEDPQFFPATLVVGLGDTLAVENRDTVPHTVGPLAARPNETYEFRFTKAGEFPGPCTVHPSQQTKIIVAPSYVSLSLDAVVGGTTTLGANMDGRPTLLVVWATWCEPCRRELPEIQSFARSNPGIKVVTVNLGDDVDSVATFLDEVDVDLTTVIDTEGRLTSATEVATVPSLAMLSTVGDVVARHSGELKPSTLDDLLDSVS